MSPDLMFIGGRVFTGDPARAFVAGVAVAGDRIVGVGDIGEPGPGPGPHSVHLGIGLHKPR